jgi:hypothetical protein
MGIETGSRLSETESTELAIREVYNGYYSEMGGQGSAPQQARKPIVDGNVAQLHRRDKPQSPPRVVRRSSGPTIQKGVPALLIFLGIVALIVLYKFLSH